MFSNLRNIHQTQCLLQKREKEMLKYFENHHDIIIKNYSDSFCKIIIKKSDDMKSDQLCLIK